MSIEFTCPNGHRLSTKDDDAGKMAKCPKCGAITKVPGLNGAASKDSGVAAAVVSGSGKGIADKATAAESGLSKSATSSSGVKASPSGLGLAAMGSIGPAAAANGAKLASETLAASAEDSIVFLCPNGHKLNAPRRMQGHAGKCPHCGAKFRIPYVDESGANDEGSR